MSDWLSALPDELATFDALATEQRRRAAAARTDRQRAACASGASGLGAALADMRARTTLEPQPRTDLRMMLTLNADEAKLLNDLSAKRALLMQTPDDEARAKLLARID
jgi:hypothetical protein